MFSHTSKFTTASEALRRVVLGQSVWYDLHALVLPVVARHTLRESPGRRPLFRFTAGMNAHIATAETCRYYVRHTAELWAGSAPPWYVADMQVGDARAPWVAQPGFAAGEENPHLWCMAHDETLAPGPLQNLPQLVARVVACMEGAKVLAESAVPHDALAVPARPTPADVATPVSIWPHRREPLVCKHSPVVGASAGIVRNALSQFGDQLTDTARCAGRRCNGNAHPMARKGGGAREPSPSRSPRIQADTSRLMRSSPYCTCPISTPPCANIVSFTMSTAHQKMRHVNVALCRHAVVTNVPMGRPLCPSCHKPDKQCELDCMTRESRSAECKYQTDCHMIAQM